MSEVSSFFNVSLSGGRNNHKKPRYSPAVNDERPYHLFKNILDGVAKNKPKIAWGPLQRFNDVKAFDPTWLFSSMEASNLPKGNVEYHMRKMELADRGDLKECVQAVCSLMVITSWSMWQTKETRRLHGFWAIHNTPTIVLREVERNIDELICSDENCMAWSAFHLLCSSDKTPKGGVQLSPLAYAYLIYKSTGDVRIYEMLKKRVLECPRHDPYDLFIPFDFIYLMIILDDIVECQVMLYTFLDKGVLLRDRFKGCSIAELLCLKGEYNTLLGIIPWMDHDDYDICVDTCAYMCALRGQEDVIKMLMDVCFTTKQQARILQAVCVANNIEMLEFVLDHPRFNANSVDFEELIDNMDGLYNSCFRKILDSDKVKEHFTKWSEVLFQHALKNTPPGSERVKVHSEDHPIFVAIKAKDDLKLNMFLNWEPFNRWNTLVDHRGGTVVSEILSCRKPLDFSLGHLRALVAHEMPKDLLIAEKGVGVMEAYHIFGSMKEPVAPLT